MLSRALASLTFIALLALCGAAIPVLPQRLALAATDQLIKASTPAVYYLGTDNKRYVFPNERIFKSWYRDFSTVQTVSDQTLATYPIGGSIYYRPGTRLVKITTDPRVYAVGPGGMLHGIASESAALALYGSAWSNRVDDLPDAFFANYQMGADLDGTEHPAGTFFRYIDGTNYYVLDNVNGAVSARLIAQSLITNFRLNTADALTLTTAAFPYAIGEIWHADDTAYFATNQPLTLVQQPNEEVPGETPNTPTPTPDPTAPAPTAATITVSKLGSLPSAGKIVVHDPAAQLFGITITGDAKQTVTLQKLRFQIFIDAGGVDTDFVQGVDDDAPVFWPASQVIGDLTLRDADSGLAIASEALLDSTGILQFTTNKTIPAGGKINLELTASAQTVISKVRIAADMVPSVDITATSSAPSLTVQPATSLNGGITPTFYITLSEFGTLVVASKNTASDSMVKLGSTLTGHELTFTATGEAFIISALAFGFTIDGDDLTALNHVLVNYPTTTGITETTDESSVDYQLNQYQFINLNLYVPKGKTVSVPVSMETIGTDYMKSNSRLQIKFVVDTFSAAGQFSNSELRSSSFADSAKLQNKTTVGPLMVLRQGFPSFAAHTESPKTSVTRYNKTPVLSFSVSATDHDVTLRQLTVRVETSDIDVDGDDNDFFERVANTFANQVIGIATHDLDISERTVVPAQSVTFKLYDSSARTLDDTPDGIQTDAGDYGIFVIDFGASPISVSAGSTRSYDIDIDTTLVSSSTTTKTIRARLLGDGKSTSPSQANFLWNDGSNILATGYLISGLDVNGYNLSVL